MSMLEPAVYFILSLYGALVFLLLAGLRRGGPVAPEEWTPPVTIVVPARNEAAVIEKCLHSLLNLNYPADKLDIIVVDDGSTDNTVELAEKYVRTNSHLRVMRASGFDGKANGKAAAIDDVMPKTSGDIIFITDADCEVPPSWIQGHLRHYNEETGMVGGFIVLTRKGEKPSCFRRLQSLDWIYLACIGSGAASLGIPLSIFGNNLSFRRKAYEEVGGFCAAGFSLIEDFSFMMAVVKKTPWKVALTCSSMNLMYTGAARNFKEFYNQRKRWILGGRNISPVGLCLLSFGFAVRLLPLVLLAAGLPKPGVFTLVVSGVLDIFLLSASAWLLKRREIMWCDLAYLPFALFQTLFFAPVFLFARSVKWKGRKYHISQSNKTGS